MIKLYHIWFTILFLGFAFGYLAVFMPKLSLVSLILLITAIRGIIVEIL